MIEVNDIILRLGAAALIGGAIGLNRDLHHKPSGLRTLALVALGAALAVVTATEAGTGPNPASPAIQGVLAGVGFLGAGVIVLDQSSQKVRGLTTAAAIWLTACLGCACGLGLWPPALVATALVALVLVLGGRIEKAVHRKIEGDGDGAQGDG